MNYPFILDYASTFQYHPTLESKAGVLSRKIRDMVKMARTNILGVSILRTIHTNPTIFNPFFSLNNILVPIPGSALYQNGNLWTPKEFAQFLSDNGLGNYFSPLIERFVPIRKSATSGNNRPSVEEHIKTLRNINILGNVGVEYNFTLIDDVLTKGSTACACAFKLLEIYPNAKVRLFTVVQTKSFTNEENFLNYNIAQSNNIICYDL